MAGQHEDGLQSEGIHFSANMLEMYKQANKKGTGKSKSLAFKFIFRKAINYNYSIVTWFPT